MKTKEIKITCQGAAVAPPQELVHFQGNLKSLSNANYERLKKQILDLGFSEPISTWKSKGKLMILNGHQRLRTVLRMVQDEGYECPVLPINYVDAKNISEAKKKVLALTSQFGTVDKDGLYEFLSEGDIEPHTLHENYALEGIDFAAFNEEYYTDTGAPDGGDMGAVGNEAIPGLGATPVAVTSLAETDNVSHVKMVQLFFDGALHKEFLEMCAELAKANGTENITDTVMEAVKHAHAALPKN